MCSYSPEDHWIDRGNQRNTNIASYFVFVAFTTTIKLRRVIKCRLSVREVWLDSVKLIATSIHHPYHLSCQRKREYWTVHPGQVTSLLLGWHTETDESHYNPSNPTCIFWTVGGRPVELKPGPSCCEATLIGYLQTFSCTNCEDKQENKLLICMY